MQIDALFGERKGLLVQRLAKAFGHPPGIGRSVLGGQEGEGVVAHPAQGDVRAQVAAQEAPGTGHRQFRAMDAGIALEPMEFVDADVVQQPGRWLSAASPMACWICSSMRCRLTCCASMSSGLAVTAAAGPAGARFVAAPTVVSGTTHCSAGSS